MMAILYTTTSTQQEVDLPLLWQTLANASKHTLRANAQAVFDAIVQQVGFSTDTPIITVTLSWALDTLSFCADSSTTLTEGGQPFNLVLAGFSTQAL